MPPRLFRIDVHERLCDLSLVIMNQTVVWGVSQKRARKALLHSALHPGFTFEFRKHRHNSDGTTTMRCTSCDSANSQRSKLGEGRQQSAHHKISSFQDGARWLTDPELNHSCVDSEHIDISTERALERQIYMRSAQSLRENPDAVSVAHERALTIVSQVATSTQQDQLIKMKFLSKRTAKKTYQKNARKANRTVDNRRPISERFKAKEPFLLSSRKPIDGAMDDEIREMKTHIAILESMLKKFKGTIDTVMAQNAQYERKLKVSQNKLAELERVEKENLVLKERIAELEEVMGVKSENRVFQ
ncbi:hypothetical protein QR680_008436 [Steinernema hermaphroditum]|uniref:Uncharacterized protein n=1 Tax=Steinernema hermaphroditum TaxID=289476 RepID=A0AA39II25_9BILA|nr:hypothetical protein QR680_008436 [Steinernema hermaphroditum]